MGVVELLKLELMDACLKEDAELVCRVKEEIMLWEGDILDTPKYLLRRIVKVLQTRLSKIQ